MEQYLRPLFEVDGVTGALLLGKDGLVIASAMEPTRSEIHAAQAAAAFDTLTNYARQFPPGEARLVLIETGVTCIALAEAADLIIVVEATSSTSLGHLRLELRRAARAVVAHLRA
jgi:predicted regulator of Ras-like GTPase activity (Roadblock/LC7/MglB family)